MSENLRLEKLIEKMKEEFNFDPDYEITYGSDDGGSYINIHTFLQELAKEVRELIPGRFMKCRVTVSFNSGK